MSLVDYKGVEVLDPQPTGPGGLAIQDNFIYIADQLAGTLVNISPVDDELGDAELATRNNHPLSLFPQSVDTAWISTYEMPLRYPGDGLTVELLFTSTATSGNFVAGASFERMGTVQDIDSDNFASEKTVTTAISGTSGVPVQATISFSDGEIAGIQPGEKFRLKIRRVGTSGSDTITGAAIQFLGGQIRGAA